MNRARTIGWLVSALAVASAGCAGSATTPASANDASPPETPSRHNVAETLHALSPQITDCSESRPGMANATITINSDGTVASATISGPWYEGTPMAACMERVLRAARFEPFQRSSFLVNFPYRVE